MKPERPNVRDQLRSLWIKYLGDSFDTGKDFISSGGDSMTAIRLIRDIESLFDMEIDLSLLANNLTLDQLFLSITGHESCSHRSPPDDDWFAL